MKKIFIGLLIWSFSCSTKNESPTPIVGDWYYFDKDTIYHQIHFFDNFEFRYVSEKALDNAILCYSQKSNLIFLYRSKNEESNVDDLFLKILDWKDNTMIGLYGEDTLIIKRLNLEYGPDFEFSLSEYHRRVLLVNRAEIKRILNGYELKENKRKSEVEIFGPEDNI